MIILSGVLVVVAIALLVTGIVMGNTGTEVFDLTGLNLIQVSIAVSIVAALFLAVGVYLRRKELFGTPARTATKSAAKARKPATRPTKVRAGARTGGGVEGETVTLPRTGVSSEIPAESAVYVVPGRKRYHLRTCRQLAGRGKQELTFEEAREEGFSPCTACMPDTALVARGTPTEPAVKPDVTTSSEPTAVRRQEGAADSPTGEETKERTQGPTAPATLTDIPIVDSKARAAAERSPAEPSGESDDDADSGSQKPEAEKGQDESAGEKSPAKPSVFTETSPTDHETAVDDGEASPTDDDKNDKAEEPASVVADDDTPPSPSPSSTENEESPEGEAAAPEDAAPDTTRVRILSGTKRYHRADCALIEDIGEDAEDLETLTRPEAKSKGCTPCLVCQPDREHAARD